MSNLIEHNAYRILGLSNNVTQKDILKRSKEVKNRLKIDDYPKYDLDVNLPENFRTEESVNDALKRLQNGKKNLIEYFFWFDIADTIDEDALNYLQYDDATSFDHAMLIWKNASETENSVGLFYKKNLTVLYCLSLLNEENDSYLKESMSNWKEIIDSDKFWILFEKKYAMINDQVINADVIREFKENVVKYVSDIYHDLYLQYNNTKYVKDFQDVFGTLGEKTEKNLLKPIHQSIYDTVEELTKIDLEKDDDSDNEKAEKIDYECDNCGKISLKSSSKSFDYEDGSILCGECHKTVGKEWQKKIDSEKTIEGSSKKIRKIQKVITKVESQLDQLSEMGLYEDDQSKVVRDHVANAIREASVMIHNEADMRGKAAELLNVAKKISGTESMKEKLELDLKKINEIIENDNQNTIAFQMGGFLRKKDLIVKNTFIEYHKTKIFYKDVISIQYYMSGENYILSIKSSKDKINVSFQNYENIKKVFSYVIPFVEPIMVPRLVESIFKKDETVTIGKINFDKNGYHSSKMFRGKSVLWKDDLYSAEIIEGIVYLFENKNNTSKVFATVPLKESNAIILPSLVDACFKEYHMRN